MKFSGFVRYILAVAALCFSMSSEVSWAYSVGGVVTGGGTPLANVAVSLFDAATSSQSGSSVVTDTAGRYQFGSVGNGTYKLFVSPPDKALFPDSWVGDPPITVSGGDVTRDVTLKQSPAIAGTVRTPSGGGVSNITVCAYNASTYLTSCGKSDANGRYSITGLTPGSYRIDISGGDYYGLPSNSALPYGFSITSYLSGVAVTGGVTRDVTLPLVTLSGKTTDPDGVPLGGVAIDVTGQTWTLNGVDYSYRSGATSSSASAVVSDATGNYSLTLLAYGAYRLILTPPSGKGVLATTLTPFDATASASKDLKLNPAYSISGAVRSAAGGGVSNVTVCAYHSTSSLSSCSKSNSAGAYDITDLSPGSYRIDISGGEYYGELSNVPLPFGFSITSYLSAMTVSGNVTRDLPLPLVTLSGRTTDQDGTPVGGVAVNVAKQNWSLNGASYSCRNDAVYGNNLSAVVSDSAGNYSMTLLSYGSYQVTLTPPGGKGVLQTSVNLDATATGARDLKLNNSYRISGAVRTPSGGAASNITVCAYQFSSYASYCSKSDSAGTFSITGLVPGSYRIDVSGGEYYGDRSNVPLPYSFSISSYIPVIYLGGNLTQDVTLPLVTLTGKTTDSKGAAVGGVAVSVPSQSWNANGVGYSCRNDGNSYSNSDSAGNYSLTLLAYGNYRLTVTPPPGKGVLQTPLYIDATTTATKDLKLRDAYRMSGVVRSASGNAVSSIAVCAYQETTLRTFCGKSDASGGYSIPGLDPGSYSIDISGGEYYGERANVPLPYGFSITSYLSGVPVSSDVTRDITLPLVTLSGKTVDKNGTAVGGVAIAVPLQSWNVNGVNYSCRNDASSSGSKAASAIVSDAAGNYRITLLAYTGYTITVQPPSSGAYAPAVLTAVSVTGDRVADITLTKPIPAFPLNVVIAGSGYVTSSPAGIACPGGNCIWSYDYGTAVTLTATPPPGAAFTGWSGACNGTGPCAVTIDAAKDVTATFSSTLPLSITMSGNGAGTVNTDPAGFQCLGTACLFQAGSSVTLMATPDSQSVFAGWEGACTNTAGNCTLTVSQAVSVSAIFTKAPKVKLLGATDSTYASLQQAFDASAAGNLIMSREGDFTETLVFSRPFAVFLKGGYDAGYSSNRKSTSRVKGTLKIRSGTVRVENLVIF